MIGAPSVLCGWIGNDCRQLSTELPTDVSRFVDGRQQICRWPSANINPRYHGKSESIATPHSFPLGEKVNLPTIINLFPLQV